MENESAFLFGYSERARLKEDMPELSVSAGAIGTVWAFYNGGGYEVEFCDNKGLQFSTIMLEDQLEKLKQEAQQITASDRFVWLAVVMRW